MCHKKSIQKLSISAHKSIKSRCCSLLLLLHLSNSNRHLAMYAIGSIGFSDECVTSNLPKPSVSGHMYNQISYFAPYYSFYISQIQSGTWRFMQRFNRILSRMHHKKSTQLSISAHKSINLVYCT